ncbi:hypothetical protein DL897_03810 [Thermoflavimicrobium daqui]|jgi:uncharacterized membrane protein YfcA|uniref:Probable membrane transporter protein n=2 Tax=Thermoflavimicrobium daqui TaxID=2137476 RepID=A0A364K843_9BACL|nr:hypothetical protein DL897_03810 [Thermoflavimicrobium daqui]
MQYLVLLLIGLVGAFFSGLLGIGGAIIHFPLLLYIPKWLGIGELTPSEVATISMFQVFFASLAGIWSFYKQGQQKQTLFHKKLIVVMGSTVLLGSFIGAWGSKFLSNQVIQLLYGILAIIALLMMLVPNRHPPKRAGEEVSFHSWLAGSVSFIVGVFSSIVGAGGSFILLPFMFSILKIPVRIAMISSLVIVLISSIGGVSGKLLVGHIPFWETCFTVLGSLLGAPLGTRISTMLHTKYLRMVFILFILIVVEQIWSRILGAFF